jgi:hypothetical protein
VIYCATPSSPAARQAMVDGVLGWIDTPAQGNKRPDGVVWCADNGCYSNKFDEAKWWRFLVRNAGYADTCLFATAPDVVGSACATYGRALPWLPKVRALGYKPAYVAQNGQEVWPMPWNLFDCLFIGGDDAWKMGSASRDLAVEAKKRGKWVHCGRINGGLRYRYWENYADSCDGTKVAFGPDKNLPDILNWVNQPALFRLIEEAS